MQVTAQQLAAVVQGTVEGNPEEIVSHLCKIEEGDKGGLAFLGNPKYEQYLYSSKASIILVSKSLVLKSPVSPTLIRVEDPYEAFRGLLHFYDQQSGIKRKPAGLSPQAYVASSVQIGKESVVGRFSVVEENTVIGSSTTIFEQVYIGQNVKIGDNTIIYPGVRIMDNCEIGNNCILQPNVVIGGDGFGFAPQKDGSYKKIAHIGNVVIEDNVEIGANTTLDRATTGSTRVRKGAKLDNLIQLAHNTEVGQNTVIAAQTGVAGSTKIGDQCRIGGQVGFGGHIQIANNTEIQAQSGLIKSIKKEGQKFFGSPVLGFYDYIKSYSIFKKLPELNRTIGRLEKELEAIKNKQNN